MKKTVLFIAIFLLLPVSAFAEGNPLVRFILCNSVAEKGNEYQRKFFSEHPEYREICPSYVTKEAVKRSSSAVVYPEEKNSNSTTTDIVEKKSSVKKQSVSPTYPKKRKKVVSNEKWCHGTVVVNKTHPVLKDVEFCVNSGMVSDAIPWLEANTESIVKQYISMGKPRRWDITPK